MTERNGIDSETPGTDTGHEKKIRSYVLRSGRMTEMQRKTYETSKEANTLPFAPGTILGSRSIFGNDHPFVVEIGIGMGAATVAIARDNPGINYLGLEVHKPGIAKTIAESIKLGLGNLKVMEHDAVQTLEVMAAESSIDAFHVFFPDPWPKKKHWKRRLLKRPFTDMLASRLKPGGYVYFVSDWAPYADFALSELYATPGLRNRFEGFAPKQAWRPLTKFERHGLEDGREIREIVFERNARGRTIPGIT